MIVSSPTPETLAAAARARVDRVARRRRNAAERLHLALAARGISVPVSLLVPGRVSALGSPARGTRKILR
jgi:hypothetical protein